LSYFELHTSSAFSFLDGASLPEALVQRAAELGYPALALLDRDGVYGLPRFHQAASRAGIKPIVGAELTMILGTRDPRFGVRGSGFGFARASSNAFDLPSPEPRIPNPEPRTPNPESRLHRLPVLVASREGYRNLSRLVTRMKLAAPKGEGTLTLDDLDGRVGGLVALAGRGLISGARFGVGGVVDRLVGIFGGANVCVELQRHLLRDEEADNHTLRALASAYHLPLVATNGVRFAEPTDRPLYDVLTCIRHKTTLERAGRRLSWNAERYLKSADAMTRLFNDIPEAITSTRELADRLEYTMADLGYRFPEYPVPAGETMTSFLRKITDAGAHQRYRPYHDRARAQIARELDLIEKLDLAGYFLIVWDIVNFCRQQDILVQGRGSAANSAVCYSLGITAVDPIGMDLLFERFLSEQRGEWPDIDLDLPSGDRRERVIQHIYQKYGKLGVGMTANVITYRGRSAAREVGKVLSLEPEEIDRLAKVMNHFEFVDPKETLERNLRDVGIDAQHPTVQHFGHLWERIQDLPRHLGQHSGGMVICQGRLDEVVPLENASMPDRVVIQWDKDDCADMGLVKVDLLGLGMMAVLQDALTLVNSGLGAWGSGLGNFESATDAGSRTPNPEPRIDLAHLPPDDPAVYTMLQQADTVGIFQVESRAQMATLPRLKPKCFYDIVVEVAIIRPGPIVGQMVHPYLKRRQGVEPIAYPHPSLEPILARTLGVPLFQEQLLRMAMVAAGFSGGEAEELRRAFGFKRSEKRMQQIEGKLRTGMARQGITGDAAEEIIRSITSFALYGFPESHAASFGLLVYASAYLKAHYPAAFYTAMLNNQPMGFYHPATLVKDAQRRGVRFASIDVQESDWECRVEPDGRVRLGLMYVNGLRAEIGKKIADGALAEPRIPNPEPRPCPKCGCDDASMLEDTPQSTKFCNICAHEWTANSFSQCSRGPTPARSRSAATRLARAAGAADSAAGIDLGQPSTTTEPPSYRAPEPPSARTPEPPRYDSIDALIACTGIRRDELATLAEIGALNAFGHDRRSALWQIERAIRPSGELFENSDSVERRVASGEWRVLTDDGRVPSADQSADVGKAAMANRQQTLDTPQSAIDTRRASPLTPMTPVERVRADYDGTSLTIGPHPMALCRGELALRGVQRATDLPRGRSGRRVRVAGAVITRQRPGTAKGFVFLTLEDETGIANVIIRPDLFMDTRATVVNAPYLLVEGILQIQDGVTSVKAERMQALAANAPDPQSHDFR
jgi:error-prone DNA polymerase